MAIYEIFQHIVEITLGPRLPRIVGRRKVYQLVGIPKQGKPSMVYTKCSWYYGEKRTPSKTDQVFNKMTA